MLNEKDQIQTSGLNMVGGDPYSRESTSLSGDVSLIVANSDGGSYHMRTSGRSSPMNRFGNSSAEASNTSSVQGSTVQSGTGSPRSYATSSSSIPRLQVPGMRPNSRITREGTDKARSDAKESGIARRAVSDPVNCGGS